MEGGLCQGAASWKPNLFQGKQPRTPGRDPQRIPRPPAQGSLLNPATPGRAARFFNENISILNLKKKKKKCPSKARSPAGAEFLEASPAAEV